MDDTATLEPEKTTKLEIYYQGVTCILKIKCSTKINKERSLKKFIKRYNAMADIMKKDKNITVKKLKEEDLDENQIETGIGATIIFNQSAEDTDCRYDIKSFMWSKSPWAFTDSEVLLANIYCCLAGYSSCLCSSGTLAMPVIPPSDTSLMMSAPHSSIHLRAKVGR